MPDIFDDVDAPAADVFDRAAGDVFDQAAGAESRSTYEKTVQSAAGAAAQSVADVGSELARLGDIGPARASFRRHEAAMVKAGEEGTSYDAAMGNILKGRDAQRERLMAPGKTLERVAGEAAADSRSAAAETAGNPWVAKAGELVGGMVPYLLAGPAAPVVAGASSAGATYKKAFDYYKGQGFEEEEARRKADEVATATGLGSAGVFAALPGFGKAAAERMLAGRLKDLAPAIRGAVNTLAASAQGSLVMGADSLTRAAQAKLSYEPDLTWEEALSEAAKEALAGGLGTALVHAPGEALRVVKESRGAPEIAGDRRADRVSEFGGAAEVPVAERPETVAAQVEMLKGGQRAAVLVTPGEVAPAVPEGFEVEETKAGRVLYDPAKLTGEDIQQSVAADRLGDVLGFGIARKPAAGTEAGVVVLRGADGTEKQAVVTDEQHEESVLRAATEAATPGDTVGIEPAEEVLKGREGGFLSASEADAALKKKWEAEASADLGKGKPFDRETTAVGPDILEWIRDNARLLSETGAKRLWGAEKFKENKSLWDDRPDLPAHHKVAIYDGEGMAPDRVAQAAFEDGMIKAPDERSLWAAIEAASKKRSKAVEVAKRDRVSMEQDARAAELAAELPGPEADAADVSDVSGDAIENWFNDAIEATNYDPGKVSEGVLGAPVWLARGAANGALRVAKAAYTTTRDLAQAIAAAIEHVRAQGLPGFDAKELQDWIEGKLGERATGQRILGAAEVSEPAKQSIKEYLYEKRTVSGDEELANGVLEKAGLDGAEQIVLEAPAELPGMVRVLLLGKVSEALDMQARLARAAGDGAKAEGLENRLGRLWDEALPKITDMAQSLRALQDVAKLSPDAQVARTRRRMERAADERLAVHEGETKVMQGALEDGRAAGVEAVRQDAQVNRVAKEAVDDAVANSEATKAAVVMELAGPWAESPHILNHAREQVRSKANELLNKDPRPPGLSANQHLRLILDDLAQRAATIAAGYFQGATAHKGGLAGLLGERLGLDEGHAGRLASGLDREFQRQLKLAQAKLPKRIAAQRVAAERKAAGTVGEGATDSQVDGAIRKQLRDLNMRLGEVLKQEAGRREETGQHVSERVVAASGLTGEKADTLRNTLQARWDALVTSAQVRALESLEGRSGVKVSSKFRSAYDKLVQLDRLGALTSERFFGAVKEALGLRRLTAADAKALRGLAARAQELPEGFMRQRAGAEVLKFTEKLSDERRFWDVPMAIFYSNILSGFTTPIKIVFENTNLLVGQSLVSLMTRPGELLRPVSFGKAIAGAYGRGMAKGVLQGADTLRSGTVSGVWAAPKSPSVMEMKPFGERFEAINFWKYFGRVIGTSHELTFKPAWEIKQTLVAREVARREGLSGRALSERVADLLANTPAQVESAKAQALGELRAAGAVDRLDLARRAREIIEQRREANIPGITETARDYALRTAYLNEPYGFMGILTKGLRDTLEKARQEHPVLGTGVKSQIPFTTIIANILNEKLNWSPVGLLRAGLSHRTGELYGRPVQAGERAELYAKAILGTMVLGAAAELFGEHVHGGGPSDPNKRKQMAAAGWIPHSIEWHGEYHSYMHTPAAVGLAVIGNYKDWNRYGKGEEADALSRVAFVAKGVANAIVSQGMLESLKRVFEALGSESTVQGGDRLTKLAARTGTGFVVPNLLQQVDRMFDPTQYDQTGTQALLQSQIPWVRRLNKPVLNVLGEPVQAGPFHYWASEQVKDPVWRFIADKQAFVSAPSKSQVLIYDPTVKAVEKTRAATDDEYYRFVQLTGPNVKAYIASQLPRLDQTSPDMVKRELEKVVRKFGEDAKAKIAMESRGVR